MITGLTIIFTCLLLGEGIAEMLRLPVPGNVLGMLLLTGLLRVGIVRLEHVKPAADVLLHNLAFLFVPAGVGLLVYGELLKDAWLPIAVGVSVSTAVVLAVVGLVHQFLEARHE